MVQQTQSFVFVLILTISNYPEKYNFDNISIKEIEFYYLQTYLHAINILHNLH